jgi:hypothetical protein
MKLCHIGFACQEHASRLSDKTTVLRLKYGVAPMQKHIKDNIRPDAHHGHDLRSGNAFLRFRSVSIVVASFDDAPCSYAYGTISASFVGIKP